ncbi:WD40 repeat domain-containing protein [Streptomyces canus]|uniref:WD40 repeat domain-containing protein n=1 Tax=Streptomyces canus TaxID=58343 RepID=UPI0027801841|nr:WD40 repeat domain-containing protein [Streptomyces canus]MDQ0757447.1 sugar lactone lactonase YvrE [Streptomyces canus]
MAGKGTNGEDTYKAALRDLGERLTELKGARGAPSYDRIRARGVKLYGDEYALSKSSMSEIFAGRRGPASLSRLLWLVRTMLAYDDGEETAPPQRRDPRLEPWRERWRTLETRRAAARRHPDTTTIPAPPEGPQPEVVEPQDAQSLAESEAAWWAEAPAPDARGIGDTHPPGHHQGESAPSSQRDQVPRAPSVEQRRSTDPTNSFIIGRGFPRVAFSPDGRLLAAEGTGWTVRLWDTQTGRPVGDPLTAQDEVMVVAFSPDGRLLAVAIADRTVRLWDIQTRNPVGKPLTAHDPFNALAFSLDGRLLAAGCTDETVRLWDTQTGRPVGDPLTAHAAKINAVAFSPDGRLLATAGADWTVRFWDTQTRDPVGESIVGHRTRGTFPPPGIKKLAFSPDGRLLATSGGDKTVRLWDTQTRTPVGEPLTAKDRGNALAFSHDGSLLAAGGRGTVRLWDTQTRTPVGEPLTGYEERITAVAFSHDDSLLATAGGTVQLWTQTAHMSGR